MKNVRRQVRGNGMLVRGGASLRTAVLCFVVVVALLAAWTWKSTRPAEHDGREVIVFWGNPKLTDQLAPVLRAFEEKYPEYRVVYSVPVTKDVTGDAQRLLCAIAGGVPPDVVYFDRFAIGEWAAKDAFEDLTPWLDAQEKNDPDRIDLSDYYQFAVQEASYALPGSDESPRVYGIPTSVDFRMLYINVDRLSQQNYIDADTGKVIPPKNWSELRRYASELSRFKEEGDVDSGLTRLGFAPNAGNSWLYLYAWQAGGEFLSPDRTKVTMDDPAVVRALTYMVDTYDDLGGFAAVDAYQSSFQSQGSQDPFLAGDLVMKIDGNWALDYIADYKRDMNFMVTAPPMPQDQLDAGRAPLTWSGGFAYVMPSTSRQKDGAFKLIQFLNSDATLRFMEEEYKQGQESAGKLYLPRGSAKQRLFEEVIEEEVFQNTEMPETFKQAYQAIREVGPNTYIRPVTPVGQLLWNKHREGYEKAVRHSESLQSDLEGEMTRLRKEGAEVNEGEIEAKLALQHVQKDVQERLDILLAPPKGAKVQWRPYMIGYAVLLLIPFIAIFWAYQRKKKLGAYRASEVGWAMFFASPWFLAMAIFIGGPILFSIVISFTQWDVMGDAHYVGFENYTDLAKDQKMRVSLGNTIFMLIRVPLSMAVGLMIAMMMNRTMRGIGIYRTLFYLPAVMPIVASAYLWMWLLNPQSGFVNQALEWTFDTSLFEWIEANLAGGSQFTAPEWFLDKHWAKPGMIIMSLWTAGSGMIIWLAGLQAIPNELYEAARIDGANWWRRFWHITIPMLTPYILFNLIMGVIGTLQIFNEAFIMTQGGPEDATLFYAYYLFQQSFQYFRMGYASALAWVLFLIVLALTGLKLWTSKKWVHYQS